MSERNVVNNRNSFSDLLYEHKPEERPLIRRIEKLNEKVNNAQAAVNFNQVFSLLDKHPRALLPIYRCCQKYQKHTHMR